jgi:hypothetical protein
MRLNLKGFFLTAGVLAAALAGSFSSAVVLGAIDSAIAAPGNANPPGNPNCDGNTPITSPARPCKGNNGFGNGGGDGTPNGKQDGTR